MSELPQGWVTANLGDVVEILDSRRVPINSDERATRSGSTPYYGATGQVGWIDGYLFDEELILLGEDGAPFLDSSKPKAYIVKGKSWINNHAHVLRALGGVLSGFIMHQLNLAGYRPFVSGSTRLKLPQGPMRQIPLRLAPTGEQNRMIAEIEVLLTDLDAAAAALNRVQANLKRYRASVLKAACEGRLVPTEAALARKENRTYETGDQLLARILKERRAKWEAGQLAKIIAAGDSLRNDDWKKKYKEPEPPDTSNSPALPEGWTVATVEQLTHVSEGMATGPFGTLIGKGDQTREGVPVVGIPNITNQGFLPGNWFHVSADKARELKRYALVEGDVIISRSGTVGEACVIPSGFESLLMSTNVMRMRCVMGGTLGRWLLTNFKGSQTISDQLQELCKGSTRPFLNQTILSGLVIRLAPLAEQNRALTEIDRRVSIADETRAETAKNLTRCTSLRKAILSHALAGKLVPQDPNDEPVSVLLDRIRVERGRAQLRGDKRNGKS